jgi:chaperone required for assembly of F1-ATPase
VAVSAGTVKRFYAAASVGEGRRILLDGKAVKTPGRRDLALPTDLLAAAIAEEWDAQQAEIDPHAMKLTGLANAAIDRIAPDAAAFARGLGAYGETDLLCYRAEGPAPLVALQAERWDPILAWARQRYDAVFALAVGIVPVSQPADTVARLNAAVAARGPFALAGLSPLVTISGSLLIALALAEGAIALDTAWDAATLDEQWQAEHWGEDSEAAAALAARRADFAAAFRFLSLL